MDLIAISDIYGDTRITKEFLLKLDNSKKNDRIIIVAGDIDIKMLSDDYYQNVNKILRLLSENCRLLIYLPGDSDAEDLNIHQENTINIDKNHLVIEKDDMKIGFFGLGGAPAHSVREKRFSAYLWDENIPTVRESLMTNLKINLEKLMISQPDYIILITHAPPYGTADYSTPITIKEEALLGEILEELGKGIEKIGRKRLSRNPRHLGSRVIKEFVKYYKPDIHIFAHIHKQGGKIITKNGTIFYNVSHLSPLPYRLTGRKFLLLRLTKQRVTYSFNSVVTKSLSFQDFLEAYL